MQHQFLSRVTLIFKLGNLHMCLIILYNDIIKRIGFYGYSSSRRN